MDIYKIFLRQKYTRTLRHVQFVVCEKFTSAYYSKLQEKSRFSLLTMYMKNNRESQSRRNFESVRALFVICTRVIILHLRYMRMHSFSANQKRVIFLQILSLFGPHYLLN